MIKKYYDQDCNLAMLDGKTIAVIGFGSQGHAHAQNLKESGMDVVVGLRKGSAYSKSRSSWSESYGNRRSCRSRRCSYDAGT